MLSGCSSIDGPGSSRVGDVITTASGLTYTELAIGIGPMAVDHQTVAIHYILWLEDGTLRDSSWERGEPMHFEIGRRRVIPGLEEGVLTMRVGGRRKLVVPPELAYGEAGAGNGLIPPDATLIFEVQLIAVE